MHLIVNLLFRSLIEVKEEELDSQEETVGMTYKSLLLVTDGTECQDEVEEWVSHIEMEIEKNTLEEEMSLQRELMSNCRITEMTVMKIEMIQEITGEGGGIQMRMKKNQEM